MINNLERENDLKITLSIASNLYNHHVTLKTDHLHTSVKKIC